MKRLVTYADIFDQKSSPETVSVSLRHEMELTNNRGWVPYAGIPDQTSDPDAVSISLRHEVELTDGRQILRLNDRGWSSGGSWAEMSRVSVEETCRMCVGPDEPPPERSKQDMEKDHWAHLQQILNRHGVLVNAAELARLPHDVVLSERLLARIAGRSSQVYRGQGN